MEKRIITIGLIRKLSEGIRVKEEKHSIKVNTTHASGVDLEEFCRMNHIRCQRITPHGFHVYA